MITINNEYVGKVRLLAVEDNEENKISVVFMEDTGLDEEDDYLNSYNGKGVLSKLIFDFNSDSYYVDVYQIDENQMIEISKIMKKLFIDKIVKQDSKVPRKSIMKAYYNQDKELFIVDAFKSNSKLILKTILRQCNIPKVSQKELEEVSKCIQDIKDYNLELKSEYEMFKAN